MLIDVHEKVIILDEAHNIEDSAREAASLSITSEELTEVTEEIEEICESRYRCVLSSPDEPGLVKLLGKCQPSNFGTRTDEVWPT